jgi:hypothetical protein
MNGETDLNGGMMIFHCCTSDMSFLFIFSFNLTFLLGTGELAQFIPISFQTSHNTNNSLDFLGSFLFQNPNPKKPNRFIISFLLLLVFLSSYSIVIYKCPALLRNEDIENNKIYF